jgi:hypothetical protein
VGISRDVVVKVEEVRVDWSSLGSKAYAWQQEKKGER